MPRYLLTTVERGDPRAVNDARRLFEEYGTWLGELVGTTALPGEIATLPAPYAAPGGTLLLARGEDGSAVGCVGVRELSETACELKRLFVVESERGHGLGRTLLRAALDHARALGYHECFVTTLPQVMDGALRMYRSLGFAETVAFRDFSTVPASVELVFLRRPL